MHKVLLTDNIAQEALDVFAEHADIEATATGTLEAKELAKVLPDFHAIIIRSPTKLTADLIEAGLQKTIAQKRVTYDFHRLMEGATKLKTSEFADAIIENM